MNPLEESGIRFISNGTSFIRRQRRDWKVTVTRTSLDKLTYQMLYPYLSIYVLALGATATQLGFVISIGMIVAAFFSPFIGWFIDRIGPKRIYLLGISLLAVSYLAYGMAEHWTMAIVAMVAYWLGNSVSIHSCAVVCGNCLANEDRAKGMLFCETVAGGLMGMVGPVLGAWIVATAGGVSVNGIRPLFFFALFGTFSTFLVVLAQLSNHRWAGTRRTRSNLFQDLHQVLQEGHYLKRWLIIASVGQLPLSMVFPFSQAFAHVVKGADEFTLAAMVAGLALAPVAFAIPLGRLADKIGRKTILYITIPLFWVSNLILVFAPNPAFLIVSGVLQGFYYISNPISAAMERELVPAEQMGRWLGIARFFRMLFNACLASVAGLIWDMLGAQYVFLVFIGLDIVLRMPLLVSMPETLRLQLKSRVTLRSE